MVRCIAIVYRVGLQSIVSDTCLVIHGSSERITNTVVGTL